MVVPMELSDILSKSKTRDDTEEILRARWYTITAVALAAAGAGHRVPELYQNAIKNLNIEDEKIVQRRIKEAILKTSCLYGVPRSLQALLPLFETLADEHIDHYGPRYESLKSETCAQAREEKGQQYFDTLWTSEAAQFHRQRNFKYQPDLYLLNLKMIYEWHFSEDTILSNIETQMCNVAALICSNCPIQAKWHTKGIIRHGGSLEDARLAQDIGLAVAKLCDCKTGRVEKVDEIDFNDKSPH